MERESGSVETKGRGLLLVRAPPPHDSTTNVHRLPSLSRDRLLDRAGHQIERIDEVLHIAKRFIVAGDADNAVRSLARVSQMAIRTRCVLRKAGRA